MTYSLEYVSESLRNLVLHPALKAFCVALTGLYGLLVQSSTTAFHAVTLVGVSFIVADSVTAQYQALRTHTWDRKRALRWLGKVVVYGLAVGAFLAFGAMFDAQRGDDALTVGFWLASAVGSVIAGTEMMELVGHANDLIGGKLDWLVGLAQTVVRVLLRIPTEEEIEAVVARQLPGPRRPGGKPPQGETS